MKSGSRWARRISATAVVVLALASVSVTVHAAVTRTGSKMAARPTPSVNLVPFQYIAKAYTELLGRAPAAAEWARAVQSFETEGLHGRRAHPTRRHHRGVVRIPPRLPQ